MKTKLTITVDENLLPEFKAYAGSVGESLSQVVEDSLKRMLSVNHRQPSFAGKWRGCLKRRKLFKRAKNDPRWDYLNKRYGLA